MAAFLIAGLPARAQTPGMELGIDLDDPAFLQEFNGSFETGLRAGAPAIDERESVIMSVISEMYQRDVDAALAFILEEVRREDSRVERAQRWQFSPELDYEYSANIEYAIGQLYQLKGNRLLAEQYYLRALEKFPSYVAVYVRLMELYLNEDDCDKAVAAGKKAVEIGGVNGFVFKGFGLCSYLGKDFDAALNAFRVASSFLPNDEATYFYHAMSALAMGYSDEAAMVLEELIRANPNNPNYYYSQVDAFLSKGDYGAALETIEIARRKGMMNSSMYFLLGNIYLEREMAGAAVDAYIAGLEQDRPPDFAVAVEPYDHLSRLGQWEEEERYLDSITDAYGGRLRDSERRTLQVLRARMLISSGRPVDGADLLRDVVEAGPTDGDALLSLARYYRQQEDFERAEIYYQRAANDTGVALLALTENAQLAADQEDWDAAVGLLTRASDIATANELPVILSNIRAIERVVELIE